MGNRLEWVSHSYRGMFVHALAFEVVEIGRQTPPPGQKWGYLVEIRFSSQPDEEPVYAPSLEDYFTRTAAEQAAFHYGRGAIDLFLAGPP